MRFSQGFNRGSYCGKAKAQKRNFPSDSVLFFCYRLSDDQACPSRTARRASRYSSVWKYSITPCPTSGQIVSVQGQDAFLLLVAERVKLHRSSLPPVLFERIQPDPLEAVPVFPELRRFERLSVSGVEHGGRPLQDRVPGLLILPQVFDPDVQSHPTRFDWHPTRFHHRRYCVSSGAGGACRCRSGPSRSLSFSRRLRSYSPACRS